MAINVVLHIANEEPVLAELEKMPTPSDGIVIAYNPRQRDGKDLRYLAANVTQVIWPMSRMTFIEIMPSAEAEKVVGFVRE